MKHLCVYFLLLALLLPLRAAEEVKGTWSVESGRESVTVTLEVHKPYQGMAEGVTVQTTPALTVTAPASTDGYYLPGKHKWVITGKPAAFPLVIKADAQYCSADGICLMPEMTQELGAFQTENDWQNGTFTPATGVAVTKPILPKTAEETAFPAYRITGHSAGYIGVDEMLTFLRGEEKESFFDLDGKGIWLTLLLVLLGGLALNLTPCVLPLIPVNLAIIGAGMNSEKSKFDRILRGLIYGLGITVAYGLLGVIAVLTGSTFGTLASSWIFNGVAALIFAFLALSMFGIFNFDLSRYGGSIRLSGAKYAGIFLLGAVSATLAGACVAPVLAAVLIRAAALYAEGNVSGLFLPFLLGLGMALPWPFAAAGMALFPKPGAWMIRVKQILGILILGLAVYYGVLAYNLAADRFSSDTDGAANQLTTDSPAAQEIRAALLQAKQENKLVLLDFWATWCKNCTMLEQNTFSDPEVQKILKEKYVLVRVQAENANDPATQELLKTYQVQGLPTLVILTPE